MAGFKVEQLTADPLGFSAEDLHNFLARHNPLDHLAPWIDQRGGKPNSRENPTYIADIPGRKDIILRWEPGTNLLTYEDVTEDWPPVPINEVPKYISIFERELGRLATHGIVIPKHTTYFVPEDPHTQEPAIYTTVERLANSTCLSYAELRDPKSPNHKIAVEINDVLRQFYLGPPTEGRYKDELAVFQLNSDRQLFDLDPYLTNHNGWSLRLLEV